MKNRTHTPAQTPQELLTDLRNLVVETEKMAADSVTEHSREAIDAIRERFEATQERLSDLYEGTKKKVSAGARYTDDAIHEKPYHAIGIAVGVAVLIGLLVGRKTR